MLKVSEFLDKSKACAGIETDYRLAKLIGISHSAVTSYRTDRTLPDERVIQKLCELTGDDPDVISALFQSRRARTEEGRELWLRVAKRLTTAAAASALAASAVAADRLYIMLSGKFSQTMRLRRRAHTRKPIAKASC